MIKANELRIGNLINYKGREIFVTMIGEFGIQSKSNDETINAKFRTFDLKPIPLTEQWLLDFGFESKGINPDAPIFTYDRFKFIYKPSYNYWYVVDLYSSTYLTKIEFVHEAQNFIFAMNSQELTLKQHG